MLLSLKATRCPTMSANGGPPSTPTATPGLSATVPGTIEGRGGTGAVIPGIRGRSGSRAVIPGIGGSGGTGAVIPGNGGVAEPKQ